MTNRVIIVRNPFDPVQTREEHVVNSHAEYLQQRYGGRLPANVVLYHEKVAVDHNVTPADQDGVHRFLALKGDVYVVEYPGTGVEVGWVIAAIVFVAALVMMPEAPNAVANSRNNSPPSANNDLSGRSNKARPNARIPDIYGKVISVPDLINRTYSVFIEHEEREYSYLCIGRGEYDVSKIKDGTTLIADIEGASAEVYGPNSSPNSGNTPQVLVGEAIGEKIVSVVRTEAANGQSMLAPNDDAFVTQIKYRYPDTIEVAAASDVDFTTLFVVGDIVDLSGSVIPRSTHVVKYVTDSGGIKSVSPDGTVTGFVFENYTGGSTEIANGTNVRIFLQMGAITAGGETVDLSGYYVIESDTTAGSFKVRDPDLFNTGWALISPGTEPALAVFLAGGLGVAQDMSGAYEIASLTDKSITFVDAGLVNGRWAFIYSPTGATQPWPNGSTVNATLALNGGIDNWIGPLDIYLDGMTNIIINLVSPNGLYKDDGTTQTAFNIDVEFELVSLGPTGNQLGAPIQILRTIEGSSITQGQRALTIRSDVELPPSAGYRVRGRRKTNKDISFVGNSVADVQWKDLYATAPVKQLHFGNVTTMLTRTVATKGALSLKSRQANAEVIRKIPRIELIETAPFFQMSTLKYPTQDFADIMVDIALDPKLGGRPASEINFLGLRTTSNEIKTYFNREACRRFNYTFDDGNASFEEMMTAVAKACFCIPYRRGNVINVKFERLTTASSLLFNHRNKLPGTEKRSVMFGIDGEYDGIEFEYVDPKDSTPLTIYLPADRSAVKAKPIQSVGVRSKTQATLLAYRAWNKIRYRRTLVEFTATHEAELLIKSDRVLVANNVKPRSQDGEIRAKVGLTLTTSQPVSFEDGVDHVVFLQATDGTVLSVPCTAGAGPYEIVLDEEPSAALSLNPANYAVATYIVAPAAQTKPLAFLVEEKTYDGPFSSQVKLINYDPRYYANDKDFSARILHYMTTPIDYTTATDEEKDAGGWWAAGGVIPPTTDPAYVYSMGPDEE